ncbi:pyridoxine/pyridoxamine 5'-phosphate oxidase isoform X2 [Calliphora vicina]|uniref:pyridoxine/pyridoxamine 5'-phosphate oxidase isoform X2 n=1 Tax=Calliphora vicina TaxID=7373 RepID=UPI00325BEFC5
MSQIKTCHLAKISNVAPTPVQMFLNIIEKIKPNPLIMNLATVDKEFDVLNRSVIYRGLTEDNQTHICFVTEKNSRKYRNLKENPKLSLTMICSVPEEFWQIRLFNAEAVELSADVVAKFWQEEPLFAKIRSHICDCGKPNDGKELDRKYQELFGSCQRESKDLEQTESYTAFKIIPKLWDFYKSEPNKIADRVQYKQIEGENGKWEIYHVDA